MPFGMYNTLSVVSPCLQDNRDEALRAITGGIFGFTFAPDMRFNKYVYAEPAPGADVYNGGICCVTGYWAPGHRLVNTARGLAIDDFAPYDKKQDY